MRIRPLFAPQLTAFSTFVTMKLVILVIYLHVPFSLGRGNISCEIPSVEPMAATSLTCTFPENLSQSRKDFSVHSSNNSWKAVVDCLWIDGKLNCFNTSGFMLNLTVTDKLTVWIPHAFPNLTGEYYCKMAVSTDYNIQRCQLVLNTVYYSHSNDTDKPYAEEENNSKTIGIAIGVVVAVLVAGIIIFVFIRKRKPCNEKPKKCQDDARHPMIPETAFPTEEFVKEDTIFSNMLLDLIYTRIVVDQDDLDITSQFQLFLENAVEKMFLMFNSFYFVPPIYLNKTRYKKHEECGQVFWVPDPSNLSEIMHDRAMEHVLHCLRHMEEEEGEEQMFILTQFQYHDYLNNPGEKYKHHHLPTPYGMAKDSVECFDFLIVHRMHGILVGVVKDVSENNAESEGSQQVRDKTVFQEVQKAVQQLQTASHIIRHLMSDQRNFPRVHQTLVLPNMSHASLKDAVAQDNALVEKLRECLGATSIEDPTERCLCSEILYDPNTPLKVHPEVRKKIHQLWKWGPNDVSMSDNLFRTVVARFFGPATRSTIQVLDDEPLVLPKTLAEAVFLTGDLYGLSILDKTLEERLDEKVVYLVGAPNTGKTRMLTLAGGKWLDSGYDVFIVKDTSSKGDTFLSKHFKTLKEKFATESNGVKMYGNIHECAMKSFTSNKKCVEEIIKITKEKKQTPVCVLLDVAHLKGNHVKKFCETLHTNVANEDLELYLWVSCTGNACPMTGHTLSFTNILNCPPAVVREVKQENVETKKAKICYLPPTDGPPVKYIKCKSSLIPKPHDCLECGNEVGSFLAKTLLITATGESTNQREQRSPLRCKDILILFEKNHDIKNDSKFLKGLREFDITVRVVEKDATEVVVDEDIDSALAMSVHHMKTYRVKKKIVVYVEYYNYKGAKDLENKQRAVTSCTSQLILVRPKECSKAADFVAKATSVGK